MLSDAQWERVEPLCAGKEGDVGRTGDDDRCFVEAAPWIGRTGAPWRDLPPRFGKWNTVFRFALLAGHRHESPAAPSLLSGLTFGALLADRGVDGAAHSFAATMSNTDVRVFGLAKVRQGSLGKQGHGSPPFSGVYG